MVLFRKRIDLGGRRRGMGKLVEAVSSHRSNSRGWRK
jgi:hypothetical protein